MKGLVLALYPTEKGYDDFYVGDTRVWLVTVRTPTDFTLEVCRPGVNQRFNVSDKYATDVMPGVKVAAGKPTDENRNVVRVVIDAPRNVRILRGKLYRNGKD